jgi:hypothetical protein
MHPVPPRSLAGRRGLWRLGLWPDQDALSSSCENDFICLVGADPALSDGINRWPMAERKIVKLEGATLGNEKPPQRQHCGGLTAVVCADEEE